MHKVPDISSAISFKTARSGGKGGQNVNKVETMVEGYLQVRGSAVLSEEQQQLVLKKLANRINAEGFLQVRSQTRRSQLGNKTEVIRKMNELLREALKKEKKRIATQPSVSARTRRLESKKIQSAHKQNRRKIRHNDY
ncbi:MAG TPA: alternative ribosome rescue aminoacyl-tRNA hydrolase ArfB [Flavitalea sp.]|nr:alternative ribosome rescue aminoacyl-tRNA hydrolase ArfB [Flavitalea sp.]